MVRQFCHHRGVVPASYDPVVSVRAAEGYVPQFLLSGPDTALRRTDSVICVVDHHKFPVQLLVYGVVGLITTTTSCVAIYMDKDMSQMEKNIVLGFYSPFAVVCMCPPHIPQFLTLVANHGVPLSWVYDFGYVLPGTVQDKTRHYKGQEKSVMQCARREVKSNGLSYLRNKSWRDIAPTGVTGSKTESFAGP